ncbi:MAG TPA: ribosome silencing factor [Rhodocyclaceae bacterium]|nr:ribosome silencing factor [Rhodocyclaceae bacterium]
MDIRKLQRIVVGALEDIKARDIEVINTRTASPLFDRVIIASADSSRQTRALARHVCDTVKAAGGDVRSVEGEETGEWVLVDLGDVVVHIMQPAVRTYYNLEELWRLRPARVARPAATLENKV